MSQCLRPCSRELRRRSNPHGQRWWCSCGWRRLTAPTVANSRLINSDPEAGPNTSDVHGFFSRRTRRMATRAGALTCPPRTSAFQLLRPARNAATLAPGPNSSNKAVPGPSGLSQNAYGHRVEPGFRKLLFFKEFQADRIQLRRRAMSPTVPNTY